VPALPAEAALPALRTRPRGSDPSACRGDHPTAPGWPGSHSVPQPAHAQRAAVAGDQSHADRHGAVASGVARAVTPLASQVVHVRLTATVKGRVQGVGFRWWTRARALELGLVGSATNLDDGRVEVVAEGPREACEGLLALLRGPGTPGRVDFVGERWGQVRGESGFVER
jgi:acylphosphatase